MVIMENPSRELPIERHLFQKKLDVAITQFGLSYPCLLKDSAVDLYKLYCFARVIKSKSNGDASYAANVDSWRSVAEEMGYKGDINAMVLSKIYKRYIEDSYEKSSSNLAGVTAPSCGMQPKFRQFLPVNQTPEISRQKRVYKRRKSIGASIKPVQLKAASTLRYGSLQSSCTRYASSTPPSSSDSRGSTPFRRIVTPRENPLHIYSYPENNQNKLLLRGRPVENLWDRVNKSLNEEVCRSVESLPVARGPHIGALNSRMQSPTSTPQQGFVLQGPSSHSYLVDNGIPPNPSGSPDQYDVDPVIRQLESGLPHEVQFALNMLLLLTKTWCLPLPKYPRLLDALLANTGVIDPRISQHWHDDRMVEFWKESQQENSFFNCGFEAQLIRATQVSVVLYNLCHVMSNCFYLLKSPRFSLYLVQCLSCRKVSIRNNGVGMLSLLAKEMSLEECPQYTDCIFKKVPDFISSSDRFLIISGLEVVSGLCKNPANHILVMEQLTSSQYSNLVQLLLVPDVQLLHITLDTIYTLTNMGVAPCEQILSVPHSLTIMMELLSVSAERLHHTGLKVLRYVKRIPKEDPPDPVRADTKSSLVTDTKKEGLKEESHRKEADREMSLHPRKKTESQTLDRIITESETIARQWMKDNLCSRTGSILLKRAVSVKYLDAVPEDLALTTTDFFKVLSSVYPGSYRQKICVGNTMKFVLKNVDWNNSRASLKSAAQVVPQKADLTPLSTPPPTPPSPPSPPSPARAPARVKVNCMPLDDADDPYKFTADQHEDFTTSRKRKKKDLMIVAEIIEEDMEVNPEIIEETEGNRSKENNDSSPNETSPRNFRSSSVPQQSSVFATFGQQTSSEYNKYKKTLTLDLSTTPEKKARIERNAASSFFTSDASKSPTFNCAAETPISPTFDHSASPTFDIFPSPTPERASASPILNNAISPTFEKASSPTFKKSGPPLFEKAASPTFEKAASPAFEKTVSPTFEKAASPTFENAASPAFEKDASPTFEKTVSPTFEKADSPTFAKAASPTFEKAASPTFEKAASPTFEKAASPTFEKAVSPTLKAASPTFEKAASPTFAKAASPTFEKAASPTFEKTVSPTFEKAAFPAFEKAASPTFEKAVSPTLKAASPTFEKAASPTFEKAASPTFEKAVSPTLKAASPTFKKAASPIFVKAASPTFENAASPMFARADSLTFSKAGSPSFEKADSPKFDKAASPAFKKATTPTFEKAASPTFEKTASPTFAKADSPTFSKAGLPSFEKAVLPTSADKKFPGITLPCDTLNIPSTDSNSSSILPSEYDSPESFQTKKSVLTLCTEDTVPILEKNVNLSFCRTSSANSESVTCEIAALSPMTDQCKSLNKHSTSPLPEINFKPSIFEQDITTNSNKLKIDEDILVSKAVIDTYPSTSECSTVTSNRSTVFSISPLVADSKLVPKTVVSNLACSNDGARSIVQTVSETSVLPPRMPHVPNGHGYLVTAADTRGSNPVAIEQVTKQQMVVAREQVAKQQMVVIPHTGVTQKRLMINDHHTTSQQMIIVPSNLPQPSVVINKQNLNIQQLNTPQFITADQQAPSGRPVIFVPHSQQNVPSTVQQMIFIPNNSVQQNSIVNQSVSSQQVVILPQPAEKQGIIVNNQPNYGQQVILFPQQQSTNSVMFPQSNPQQVMVVPQKQVLLAPTNQPTLLPAMSQPNQSPILIAPHNSHHIRISPKKSGPSFLMPAPPKPLAQTHRLVVLSQATSSAVLVAPSDGVTHHVMISSHTTPLILSPVVTSSKPILISSLTGDRVFYSSASLMTTSAVTMTSSGDMMSSSSISSDNTSCTSVYSKPVVCAVPAPTNCTLSHSPLKTSPNRPVLSTVQTGTSFQRVVATPSCTTSCTPSGGEVSKCQARKRLLPPRPHTYPCYWAACTAGFESEKELSDHLVLRHVTAHVTNCQWITCSEQLGTRSKYSLIFHVKQIHARAPHLTHLPPAGKVPRGSSSRGWSDTPESPVTRSVRLLTALIVRNILRFTPELVSEEMPALEERCAIIAMSSLEASNVMSDCLGLIYDATQSADNLPPFR